jgi:predicted tellurium resistance membrane protein TerC
MARYPFIVTLGAGLIGWVGGETIVTDAALSTVMPEWQSHLPIELHLPVLAAAAGAVLVMAVGKLRQSLFSELKKPS